MKAAFKSFVRTWVRRLVPVVSSRPWLVAIAARVFARMPSLKHRVRNMMSGPVQLPPAPVECALGAAEAGVLADLKDAVLARGSARR